MRDVPMLEFPLDEYEARINKLFGKLEEAGCSLRDAVRQTAQALGLSRNELYQQAVGRKKVPQSET